MKHIFKEELQSEFTHKRRTGIILSLLAVVLLLSSGALAATVDIRLWDSVAKKWTTDNIKSYAEGDCIPGYISATAAAGEDVYIIYDYFKDYKGVSQLEYCGACPGNPLDPPTCSGGDVLAPSHAPAGTTLELIPNYGGTGGLVTYAYKWHFNTAGTYCFRFCARISDEASLFAGSSMHVNADPGPDVPIPTGQFYRPDLVVSKTASVDPCGIVTYTITYKNQQSNKGNDQTGVILEDVYDPKVEPIPGQLDGGVNANGKITWNIGDLGQGKSGTKTFSARIKGDYCAVTSLTNTVTIAGDRTDSNPADNTFTLITPIALKDEIPPVIACPPGVTVGPGDSLDPAVYANLGAATATDNCGTPTVTYSDVTAGACPDPITVTRTWTATDGCGNTATCVQIITVTCVVNNAPVAVDDTYSTNEDTTLTVPAPGVLGNDTDSDGDALTVTANTNPSYGVVTVNADGSLTYTPNANYSGTDSFTYTISDGQGGSDTATVTIIIKPVNDAPNAVDDTASVDEDNPVIIAVLGNDADPEMDPLTVTEVSDPDGGSVVINPDGTVTYAPDANFCGTDSFSYTVSDGNGGTDSATVTVTVACLNDAPDAVDDSATTDENTPVGITVLQNDADPDGDVLTVTTVSDPANGLAVINADGTVTYTPDAGFSGQDTFTYTITDEEGLTDNRYRHRDCQLGERSTSGSR